MSSPSLVEHLVSLLLERTASLDGVGRRKMFGCEAFFRDGTIFALVWKEGRIALKLPDPALFSELRALPGSHPWSPGAMKMSSWLLVPEDFHDDEERLDLWVRRAWTCAALAPPKKAKAAAKRTGAAARATSPPAGRKGAPRTQPAAARARTRAAPRAR